MSKKMLSQELAKLEKKKESLVAELVSLNELLKLIGFSDGLNSLKKVAEELLTNNPNESDLPEE